MIFALDVVQPAPQTEEGLVRCQVVLCLGHVDEAYGMQQLGTIRFLLEFAETWSTP